MTMTLPADRTRMAITWSSRVSTPLTGSAIVRRQLTVTLRYTAIANIYTAEDGATLIMAERTNCS